MPARATVTVDLGKVRANARTVVDHLPGISVVAVTKVTCGSPAGGSGAARGRREGAGRVAPGERPSAFATPASRRRSGCCARRRRSWPARPCSSPTSRCRASSRRWWRSNAAAAARAAARHRRHGRPRRPARGHAAGRRCPPSSSASTHGPRRHGRHRGQPHLLRRDRARRAEPRAAGRAGRASEQRSAARCSSRAATPAPSAWPLRPHAGGRQHAAHRREHPARRRHAHARAHARPAPGRLHAWTAPVIECLVKPSLPAGRRARRTRSATCRRSRTGATRRRAICALGRQDAPPEGLTAARPARRGPGRVQRPPHPRRGRARPPPRAGRAASASCRPTLRPCSCSRRPTSTKCSLRRPDTRIVARRDLQPQE